MKDNKDIIVKMWFDKANSDLQNIENNLKAKNISVDTICFHAQQAIEKYIKGSLVYFKQDISKTHDLVKILSRIAKFIPELSKFEEKLEEITEFAVEVRYPDSFYIPSLEDAKKSYEIALKVKKIILNKIKI